MTKDMCPDITRNSALQGISDAMEQMYTDADQEDAEHGEASDQARYNPGATLVIGVIDSVLSKMQGIERALGIPSQIVPVDQFFDSYHIPGPCEDIHRVEGILQELFVDEPLGIVIVMEGSDTGIDPFEELVLPYFLGDDASLKIRHNSSGKQHLDLSNGARISSSRGVQRKKNRFC